MPKETFFHLTEEKKQRIMNAAEKEFSIHPLKDASIAMIIKEAEIPRGSFYQYFEDKEDLYYYYFNHIKKNSFHELLLSIEKEEGDLFAGFDRYFEKMISRVLKGNHANFYRNLFMNMDYRSFHKVSPEMSDTRKKDHSYRQEEHKQNQQVMMSKIDRTKLRVTNDEELHMLWHMMMHTVFTTIVEGYRHLTEDEQYDVEKSVQSFKRKVSWIEYGASQAVHNENNEQRGL